MSATLEHHHGVIYDMRPVVCERHRMPDGTEAKAVMKYGMVGERGLTCSICYGPARHATEEEAALLHG